MSATITQTVPTRRPVAVAVNSDPSMDEALARVRRDRRQQAVAHSLQAAVLADEAGWTDAAAGFRADADRMRKAMAS
ncbi:hypothetical protein ADK55_18620 [Streptomyces sp. WM4235]|uniref:hypothetical protein n=1 Tax=Streptomyces sp. WM4235 TaxID=1415551 RepID=UPI0006AE52B2|nr:hypothetical protein [Streptomyces sp. WM4235]KOU50557.1 hypothetical protein ADK55_18620 [Streptomyces sp. WM4235]